MNTFQKALGLSVAVHAIVLAVRFVDPEPFRRVFEETPLEVILVNAKTAERPPEKAQALAQATLTGGGDLDQGRATSPLPPSAFTTTGDSIEDAQRRNDARLSAQMELLTQIRQLLATLPAPNPHDEGNPDAAAEREAKRRQLTKQFAEIERRINEENARPRKRYISPATREVAYAAYVDALLRRTEARGTENFPQADGKKLYGQLRMRITINFDGSLLAVDVIESSGNQTLDFRARAIVRSLGNFGPFTDAMRQQTDQIGVFASFNFTPGEKLETQLLPQ